MGEIINVRRTKHDTPRGAIPDYSVMSPEHARTCLAILAEEGGDAKKASQRCRDEGHYPASAWELTQARDKHHPKIWVDVHTENEKRLEQIAEAQARENAIRASVVASRAVQRIDAQLDDADLLGAAKALDSLTKAQSISTDAVLKWSGRPVQGGPAGSMADTLKELQRIAPGLFGQTVDSDAEVVDE